MGVVSRKVCVSAPLATEVAVALQPTVEATLPVVIWCFLGWHRGSHVSIGVFQKNASMDYASLSAGVRMHFVFGPEDDALPRSWRSRRVRRGLTFFAEH